MPSDRPRTLEEEIHTLIGQCGRNPAASGKLRAAILSALREAEARGRAQGDALRAEVEDRRDRWLAAKQGAFMHAETMQLCGTELRLMLERLAPGSREPGPRCDAEPETRASLTAPPLQIGLSAWSLDLVLERLADAADHLRGAHNCDAHGHEGVLYAAQAAREHVKILRGSREPGAGEGGR
jgi:hypothetical protein